MTSPAGSSTSPGCAKIVRTRHSGSRKEIQMGKSVRLPLVAELREENAELRSMLERLTEKVERANRIRHSGGRLIAEDWSELYSLTNEARGKLAASAPKES